ncbi:MAG: inorganic phosphate transporter [Micrococcales bacterium]|nr:inorganic phosphate transporter [Micrococcales bacterium]
MEGAVLLVILLGIAFDVSNGFHDSSNAIAALVATRAARPGPAVVLASVFTILGPILVATAVADTVGGLLDVDPEQTMAVLLSALVAGLLWNIATWYRGLPSSSSHALVGGLVGAALVVAGPSAVVWGGFNGVFPYGVLGVLVGLAISPLLGAAVAWVVAVAATRATRRASRQVRTPVLRGEWVTAATLSFAHGANDAQKTMGLLTLALVAGGVIPEFVVPLWVKIVCGLALTVGTALGGWRIVRTIGRRIYRLRPLDGLVSSGSSSVIIGLASAVGAPVSTTHVVSSSVVGVGASQRRRHVGWTVVRDILLAWIVTLPGCALLGALVCALVRMVV